MIIHTIEYSTARAAHYNTALITNLYANVEQRFLILKSNEAAVGKNQQTIDLKVLIFRFHRIMIYFADFKFPNEESVTT